MIEKTLKNKKEATNVAKRMFWLAYNASEILGMGMMSAVADATEDDVYKQVSGQDSHDYISKQGSSEKLNGDYVFGRMMKLTISVDGKTLLWGNDNTDISYQSWAKKYPTKTELFEAAVESLK